MIYLLYKAVGNILKTIIGNNSIITQICSFGYHPNYRFCYVMHNVDVRKLKFNFSGKVSPQKSNSSGKISQKVVCLHVKNKMF